LGAVTAWGKFGLDSVALRPMTPPKGGSGAGRMTEPPGGVDALCATAGFDSPMQVPIAAAMATVSSKRLVRPMGSSYDDVFRSPLSA
jgi:hypothetical protein